MTKPLMLGLFFAACAALHLYAKITQPELDSSRSAMSPPGQTGQPLQLQAPQPLQLRPPQQLQLQPNDHDDLDDPDDHDDGDE